MNIWKSYIWTADKDVNMKAIFAVMNTTWAVVKIRPEKNSGLYGIWTHDHCTGIAEVMGSNPVQAWIFSGLIFTTAEVVFITAKIAFILTEIILSQMGQLRDDLRRTTEQYRELNQALAQQQQQITCLQVSCDLFLIHEIQAEVNNWCGCFKSFLTLFLLSRKLEGVRPWHLSRSLLAYLLWGAETEEQNLPRVCITIVL